MAENALNTIFKEVGEVFRPLRFLDSGMKVTTLFRQLGYALPGEEQFPGIPGLVSRIDGVIGVLEQFGNAGSEEEQYEAIINLADEIRLTAQEVSNLDTVVTGLTATVSGFATNAPLNDLPRRLIDFLLIDYTYRRRRPLHGVLAIIGFFDHEVLVADAAIFQPAVRLQRIRWERLPKYFSAPDEVFDQVYNWKTDFDSDLFLERLDGLLKAFLLPGGIYAQSANLQAALQNPDAALREIRIPVFQNGVWPGIYSQFGITLTPAQARDGLKKGMGLFPYVFGAASFDFDLNEHYEIVLTLNASLDAGVGVVIRPPFDLTFVENVFSSPQDAGSFLIEFVLRRKESATEEYILLGAPNSSRLSVQGPAIRIFAIKDAARADFGFEFGIDEIKIVIGGGDGDGFLQTVLPEEGINATFSFTLGYSIERGFYFAGSGSFEIVVASHIALGPLSIHNLALGFAPGDQGLGLITSAGLKLELGPFIAVVEGLGLKADLTFPDGGGNLGPADLDFGFKPPTGIGLSLDTSVVKGGGYLFFDPDNERYGGALELAIADKFLVTAIGLITTRFPDGSKGFSLLLLINVQFAPGIALGMGFFLSGLGGMIGINRTINTDALREGVKTNSIDHILFPEDVVANIQRIITDLREFFPPERDQFIIGLMAKITWGVPTLVSIEFGLAVEFANPVRIVILGVLKVVLPTEDEAIVRIQVSFVGIIDFEEEYLTFDASLYGSKILTFSLDGDMALRLFWGKEKAFLMSVGGFHPAFQAPAFLKVARMTRLTLSILSGNPNLTLTTYFAVTSNTVQFGAQIDFYFKVSKFKVIGYFGFDVLFQFSPFRFIANIRAGVEVKLGSSTLFSIKLEFELQGPTPWIASGTASFRILFIKIKVRFSKTWGERREDTLPSVPVLPKLLEAFEQSRNWLALLPSNRFLLTTLREVQLDEGEVIMHAMGALTVSQNIVPLGMELTKFGNFTPQDINRAEVVAVRIDGEEVAFEPAHDSFAPAEFKDMEDDDKLKSPSYKEERSGVKVTSTDALSLKYAINRLVEYEVRVSDYDKNSEDPYELYSPVAGAKHRDEKALFRKMARGGAAGKSALGVELRQKRFRQQDAVLVQDNKFTIASTATLKRYGISDFIAGTRSEADDKLKSILRENPKLKGELQIVSEYQLAD